MPPAAVSRAAVRRVYGTEPGRAAARFTHAANEYAAFGRTVLSLSLLAPCVMDFRHVATGRKESLLQEPRSHLVRSEEAWYDWEHGIAPRKRDVRRG